MNSTTGANTDAGNSAANRIALAAAILAAGAFVVAFAQTVLQYFSSSESRNKCTRSAIDVSSKQVKFGWSWKFWKLRVYYPALDFNYRKIVYLLNKNLEHQINAPQSAMTEIAETHEWLWLPRMEKDAIDHCAVADPFTRLVDRGGKTVTSKDLSWKEAAKFYRWRCSQKFSNWNPKHPLRFSTRSIRPVERPRASWAQLLLAFGLRDTRDILYDHKDADLIPSSIDVPVQRIMLYDLGFLCLLLGFNSIEIDQRKREFTAIGRFGIISTYENSDLGKFLRFDGDIFSIHGMISRGHIQLLRLWLPAANGNLTIGPNYIFSGYFYPLDLLARAVTEHWDGAAFHEKLKESSQSLIGTTKLARGQVAAEAALIDEISKSTSKRIQLIRSVSRRLSGRRAHNDDPRSQQRKHSASTLDRLLSGETSGDEIIFSSVCKEWQDCTDQRIPTIIAVGTIGQFGAAIIGFPSRILLQPFLPWIASLALELYRNRSDRVRVSENLQSSIQRDSLGFLRANDTFWLTYEYCGLSIPGSGHLGWIYEEMKNIYDSCDEQLQNEIIERDSSSNYNGAVNAVLFPETLTLLSNFDPRGWALRLEHILSMSPMKYRPANMLWAQVLLLDVAIHYLVRKGWRGEDAPLFEVWSKETIAVVQAVVESWKDGATPDHSEVASGTNGGLPSDEVHRPEDNITFSRTVDNTSENARLQFLSSESSISSSLTTRAEASVPPNSPPYLQQSGIDSFAHVSESKELKTPPSPENHQTLGTLSSLDSEAATLLGEHQGRRTSVSSLSCNNPPISISFRSWDLANFLSKQVALFPHNYTGSCGREVCQIEELLKLRAVFFLAFLMLNPDSSDIYLAEESGVEMPMV